jgi:hypothetical protein
MGGGREAKKIHKTFCDIFRLSGNFTFARLFGERRGNAPLQKRLFHDKLFFPKSKQRGGRFSKTFEKT